MWKNPHVFKHAAQYGLRTHFASDVRTVRAMVTFLLLKCEHVCQGNSSAQRVPEEREDFQDQCFIFLQRSWLLIDWSESPHSIGLRQCVSHTCGKFREAVEDVTRCRRCQDAPWSEAGCEHLLSDLKEPYWQAGCSVVSVSCREKEHFLGTLTSGDIDEGDSL